MPLQKAPKVHLARPSQMIPDALTAKNPGGFDEILSKRHTSGFSPRPGTHDAPLGPQTSSLEPPELLAPFDGLASRGQCSEDGGGDGRWNLQKPPATAPTAPTHIAPWSVLRWLSGLQGFSLQVARRSNGRRGDPAPPGVRPCGVRPTAQATAPESPARDG